MTNEIEVLTLESQPTMTIRITCSADELGASFMRILPAVSEHVSASGGTIAGPAFGRYYTFSPEKVDLEAGYPVADHVAETDEIKQGSLPGGRVARLTHKGDYAGLGDAHMKLDEWVHANGGHREGDDGPWESYVTDPQTAPPEEWITALYSPLG